LRRSRESAAADRPSRSSLQSGCTRLLATARLQIAINATLTDRCRSVSNDGGSLEIRTQGQLPDGRQRTDLTSNVNAALGIDELTPPGILCHSIRLQKPYETRDSDLASVEALHGTMPGFDCQRQAASLCQIASTKSNRDNLVAGPRAASPKRWSKLPDRYWYDLSHRLFSLRVLAVPNTN
jgi:hypothetical protein